MRNRGSQNLRDSGFTLIESMVALVILGIAAVGIVQAVETHIDRLYTLEQRAAAQWVAENALAEARLGTGGANGAQQAMLGWRWAVTTRLSPSEDADLSLALVEVRLQGTADPMVTLRGFVDTGRVTP
ncbi:MAG: type II secretion system minor pseudopilin GspI [Parerythrobacter sp.]